MKHRKVKRVFNPDFEHGRNYVAAHAHDTAGAGAHDLKKGNLKKRCKQKREWKRDLEDY